MKKTIALLMLAMLATTVNAQLLWKITPAEGSEAPASYLLGTYHLIGYDRVDSITGVKALIPEIDCVVGEMDMAEAMSPESQMKMIYYAGVQPDSALSQLFTPLQLDSIQVQLDRYAAGVNIGYFDQLCPAFLSVLLETGRATEFAPVAADAVDAAIQSHARSLGKEVQGLETVDDQCKALFGFPVVEQAEALMWSVANEPEVRSVARRIFDAYCAGDLKGILAVIEDEKMMGPDHSERLIEQRNISWLHILAGMLPAASLLIVVGAGHLPGEKGMIEGLRRLGYNVTPER